MRNINILYVDINKSYGVFDTDKKYFVLLLFLVKNKYIIYYFHIN